MNQIMFEKLFHHSHLKSDIKSWISTNTQIQEQIDKTVDDINTMLSKEYWESRNTRMNILKSLDIKELVIDLLVLFYIHAQKDMPLSAVLALYPLPNMDKLQSIQTVGELIYYLFDNYLVDLSKQGSTVFIKSSLEIKDKLINIRIKNRCVMPPMIQKPRRVKNNRHSGYLTIKSDSLILGHRENYHDNELCLDVINTQNQNSYKLDMDFINTFEKAFHKEYLSTEEIEELSEEDRESYLIELDTFKTYQIQFKELVKHLKHRPIYLLNKVDKRGRIYTQGFHFNTQGTSFEKGCISLSTLEKVTGDL